MSGRDHPFNRSTRPLLERSNHAQPQLLSTKKKIGIPTPTIVSHAPKMRGFNDFTFVPKIHSPPDLHSYYSGYPYGSPPSPTTAVGHNDFVFSDDSGIHSNDRSHNISSETHRAYDDDYADIAGDSYQYSMGGVYQSIGGGAQNADIHRWGPAPVSVESAKGPFIFGVDTSATTAVDRFRQNGKQAQQHQHFNNNSVIHSNAQKAEQQVIKKADKKPITTKGASCDKRPPTKKSRRKRNKENDRQPKAIKCVVVGDAAVGKTNLICTYLENRFVGEHIPTASDMFNFEVTVDESPVLVTLCDTAGQDALDPLRQLSYPDCDIFLLCFSVVQPDSFESLKRKWVPQFTKSYALILLVGTQSDLRNDPTVLGKLQSEGQSPVSVADAWDTASSIGAKYIETSSRFRVGVKDAFDTAIWEALVSLNIPRSKPLWKKLLCLA